MESDSTISIHELVTEACSQAAKVGIYEMKMNEMMFEWLCQELDAKKSYRGVGDGKPTKPSFRDSVTVVVGREDGEPHEVLIKCRTF